jgi:hypothetical protein
MYYGRNSERLIVFACVSISWSSFSERKSRTGVYDVCYFLFACGRAGPLHASPPNVSVGFSLRLMRRGFEVFV